MNLQRLVDRNMGDASNTSISLARWDRGVKAGRSSSSSRYCLNVGTWNVRTIDEDGKLENVIQEMEDMKLGYSRSE